jgi:glycosyltransferase involved in cell wall biosynthesis
MNVLLECSPVSSDPLNHTGLARVALNLARFLNQYEDIDLKLCAWGSVRASFEFNQYLASQNELSGYGYKGNFSEKLWLGFMRNFKHQGGKIDFFTILLGQLINILKNPLSGCPKNEIDLIHSTYARFHPRLPKRGMPRLITVHDLTPFQINESYSVSGQRGVTARIIDSIRPNDFVACVSSHTRNDFLEYSGHDANRCRVIYNGFDQGSFFPASMNEKQDVRERYLIGDSPFLLTLSSLAPHKNIQMVLRLWKEIRYNYSDAKLVICGGKSKDIVKVAMNLGISEEETEGILMTGYVQDEEYRALASAANAFLFPSLYEGFGLPVLEAMACGCPVIASNRSSIPEVVGEAGTLLDPDKIDDWREAMCVTLSNGPRQMVSQLHLQQAKLFSWERTASEYYNFYEEILSGSV